MLLDIRSIGMDMIFISGLGTGELVEVLVPEAIILETGERNSEIQSIFMSGVVGMNGSVIGTTTQI
jgi:hypothetical protein